MQIEKILFREKTRLNFRKLKKGKAKRLYVSSRVKSGGFALFTKVFQEFFLRQNKIQSFQIFNMLLLTSLT